MILRNTEAKLLGIEVNDADELEHAPIVIGEKARLRIAEQADRACLLDLLLRIQCADPTVRTPSTRSRFSSGSACSASCNACCSAWSGLAGAAPR